MNIKLFKTGLIKTNTYIVWDDSTLEGMIIDPAGEEKIITKFIQEKKLVIKYIVNTHGHFDHTIANKELSDEFSADILIHKDDEYMLYDNSESHAKNYNLTVPMKKASRLLEEGDVVTLGKLEFKIMHTPGHSKGGICLFEPNEKVLFSGDTLFWNTHGRVDLPESNMDEMQKSLTKLDALPDDTKVYPGHGKTTTIEYEKKEGILVKNTNS
jgi:glyoxylase-like metal-dependent hydrolase (beta-lactamase superfamily II)